MSGCLSGFWYEDRGASQSEKESAGGERVEWRHWAGAVCDCTLNLLYWRNFQKAVMEPSMSEGTVS